MAYTSIIPVRCLDRAVDYVRDKTKTTRGPKSLQDAVDYAINREKTELDCFETGLSCVCETAFEDMRDTVQRWQQTAGVQGYHLVQSFAEGEVTPELAHQIGVELAEQLLQGRFQTVVTTHLNTKHYHNHIVWCSVALDNGRKYHSNAKSYYTEVRARSDALCRKYGLSIIETKESEQSSMPYHVWLDEQENRPNWTSMVRQDVDEAISQALTWRQFLQCLSQKGYTFRFNRKYPTLKPPGKPRPIRFKTLGKQYTPEAIQQRILYSQKTYPAEPHVRHVRLHGTYQKVRKLKGLRVFYYRELYMLGVFHRKPWHPSPAVREEIRQLDKRMPMHRNKIDMPRTKRLTRRAFALYAALVLVCCAATPVLAEGDPLTVVNNLSTFIFSIIRAIGLILLGWGIVQVGLSLQSHDPSQRSQGFLTLAGGIIITFAKEILDLIVGTGV